ncbi:MAG: zf-HC2 domain-containing protein [candidate division WOR-3 bacterium]|nr:zf-HC2 domain-containing protein [candidate division WOR-3 bacterium]MCX7757401.1 zf-HC2 domain-containing protein [candidate division WOR-3 bacterium]MDW7987879.1 zf-HC2 domain-containing protein [candidate division WOR-3 bacterium]
MISCYNIKNYLFEYIDGELNQEMRIALAQHLAMCSQCLELYQAYSRLITLCHHCCNLEVPTKIHEELLQFIENLIQDTMAQDFSSYHIPPSRSRKRN